MREKRDPKVTFRGLAPGECPVVVIEAPCELPEIVEQLLKTLYGNAPIVPLTTRGA